MKTGALSIYSDSCLDLVPQIREQAIFVLDERFVTTSTHDQSQSKFVEVQSRFIARAIAIACAASYTARFSAMSSRPSPTRKCAPPPSGSSTS